MNIVQGISLHERRVEGFRQRLPSPSSSTTPAIYSAENVALNAEGSLFFLLDIKAGDFLRPRGERRLIPPERVAPIAALIVSGHFSRLGRFRAISVGGTFEYDARRRAYFLASEERRQSHLLRLQGRSDSEVQYWTGVLQFCDLLSLYLCCGSEASVEFPQRIGPKGETIRLHMQAGVCVTRPAIFARQVSLCVELAP